MNYRHAFHAGNFADLLKHAVLTALLADALARPGPLTVIDTHAGAGTYDLGGEDAMRTGEGEAAATLMAAPAPPAAFDALRAAIARLNEGGGRLYPGSPEIAGAALRPGDQLIACETRREVFEKLRRGLRRYPAAQAVCEDGWDMVRRRAPRAPARAMVLIDPPYEASDDAAKAAAAVRQILGRNAAATIAVWAPIKDLAGFDALLADLEDAARGRPLMVAETRLRPLDDPTRLNGCAMVVVNPPEGLERPAGEAAAWLAETFGEHGAFSRARRIGRG